MLPLSIPCAFSRLGLLIVLMGAVLTPVVHGQGSSDFGGFVQPGSGGADVDLHSGQFQFSMPVVTVPGAQGEGYTLSLGYRGPTPMEEASWVGYGWSLSPGSIVRQVNGIPDDFEDRVIININKHKPYTQFRVHAKVNREFKNILSAGGNVGVLIDSHRGVLPSYGANAGFSLYEGGITGGLSLAKEGSGVDFGLNFSFNPIVLGMKAASGKGGKRAAKKRAEGLNDSGAAAKESWESSKDEAIREQIRQAVNPSAKSKLAGMATVRWSPSPLVSLAPLPNQMTTFSVSFSSDFQGDDLQMANHGAGIGFQGSVTRQVEDSIDTVQSFGYLYSSSEKIGPLARMDFSEDMAGAIQKRDQYLPIPIANPDRFMVQAGGLSGAMRLHTTQPIKWQNRGVRKSVAGTSVNAGVEISLGPVTVQGVGIAGSGGGDVGGGVTLNAELQDWSPDTVAPGTSGLYYFAFDGDPGHQRHYDSDTTLRAEVKPADWPRKKELEWPEDPAGFHSPFLLPSLTKSVKFNVNQSGKRLDVLNRDARRKELDDEFALLNEQAITEMEVTGEDGTRYVFGLPVLCRNQGNLTFRPEGLELDQIGLVDQKLALVDTSFAFDLDAILASDEEGVVSADLVVERFQDDTIWNGADVAGTIMPDACAAEFLLTAMYSSDYRDLTANGPSEDDLGTYVRFTYTRKYGGSGDWFKHRTPIEGFWYEEGSVSDERDDRLSYTFEERELYVLDTVETKTHAAVFHHSQRADRRGVLDFRSTSDGMNGDEAGAHSYRCDSIQLFRKLPTASELLSTTYLDYDYALCPENPSHPDTGESAGLGGGKLTLQGVYVSSQEVVDTTSFVEFDYHYPALTHLPTEVLGRYQGLFTDGHSAGNTLNENPDHSHNHANAWGYMRSDEPFPGDWRYGWESAGTPKDDFDPAAYHLKQIHLASGATVLPQYERGQFRHIQDKAVHGMIPVQQINNKTIGLNLSGHGGDAQAWREHLDNHFAQENQGQVYFKFHYRLGGTKEEFFSGFAQVKEVSLDLENDMVLVHLKDSGEFALPVQACRKFAEDFPRMAYGYDMPDLDGDVMALATKALAGGSSFGWVGVPCASLVSDSTSFLRLPLLSGDVGQGGPPRVTRLLHLDRGIEAGDAMLYGRQFDYTTLESRGAQSSGVAADLPAALTDVNPLFYPLPNINYKPNILDKANRVFVGRDLGHGTGPLASTLMPSASVSYGEVIESKIHSGRSAEGFAVSRYHTHLDHPFHVEPTDPDEPGRGPGGFNRNIPVPTSPFAYTEKQIVKTQGYRVFRSSMPGNIEEVVAYGGSLADVDSWTESSRTEYEYFNPFDRIGRVSKWSEAESGLQPGHFEEVYHMGRRAKQQTLSANASLDIGGQVVAIPGPPSVPIYKPDPPITLGNMPWAHVDLNKSELATHVTTTVINLPATLKSVRTTSGSKEQTVEHVAFDPITGQAVRSATTDGFTGEIREGLSEAATARLMSATALAHEIHPELGAKSVNDRKTLISGQGELLGIQLQVGVLNPGNGTCRLYLELLPIPVPNAFGEPVTRSLFDDMGWRAMDNFSRGDELLIEELENKTTARARVAEVEGNRAYLDTWYISPASELASLHDPLSWIAPEVKVTVLNSGRQNQWGMPAGSVQHYGDELDVQTESRAPADIAAILDELNGLLPNTDLVEGAPHQDTISFGGWASGLSAQEFSCDSTIGDWSGMCMFLEPGGRGFLGVGSNSCSLSITTGCNYTAAASIPGPTDPMVNAFTIPIHHADGRMHGGSIGAFEWDGSRGAIVWRSPDNPDFPVVVFTLCGEWWDLESVSDVVAAEATLWNDDLGYALSASGEMDLLDAEEDDGWNRLSDPWAFGLSGRWRPVQSLAFNEAATGIVSESGTLRHTTESGLLTGFVDINRHHPKADGEQWVSVDSTLAFDEHARPIESANALDHRTAQRFGLDDKLPIWSSRNASVEECFFESCENTVLDAGPLTDSGMELGGLGWTDSLAHSGHASVILPDGNSGTIGLPNIKAGKSMAQSGVRLRFWMHDAAEEPSGKCTVDELFEFVVRESSGDEIARVPVDSLAQTGQWVLLEAVVWAQDGLIPDQHLQLDLAYNKEGLCLGSTKVYLDDIKVQPARSLMTCNVYDPLDYKVLATLDENHFATYRQYNLRNEHIRTLVETLEGVKTVGEQYLHQKNLD